MGIIWCILVSAVAFYLAAYFLPGVEIKSFVQALLVAIIVSLLSSTLGTILKFISLGLLTWGILAWVLNAIIIMVADYFLTGFKVKNFWWALALGVIVSVVSSIFRAEVF